MATIFHLFFALIAIFWMGRVYGRISQKATVMKLTAQESAYALWGHNTLRRREISIAMKQLTYSDTLATQAEQVAQKCAYNNSGSGLNYYPSAGFRRPVMRNVLNWWWGQRKLYTYSRRVCYPGRFCDFYEQLAFNKAGQFGCGMAACADLANTPFIAGGYLMVCKYDQAGPAAGQPPYNTTSVASPRCSQCSQYGDDWICLQNLCVELADDTGTGGTDTGTDNQTGTGTDQNQTTDTGGDTTNTDTDDTAGDTAADTTATDTDTTDTAAETTDDTAADTS